MLFKQLSVHTLHVLPRLLCMQRMYLTILDEHTHCVSIVYYLRCLSCVRLLSFPFFCCLDAPMNKSTLIPGSEIWQVSEPGSMQFAICYAVEYEIRFRDLNQP